MKKGEIFYISGPMSGLPNFNKEAFFEAEEKLNEQGFAAVNPARLPDGRDYAYYMDRAYSGVSASTAIVILPGWRDSLGAIQERCWAHEMGKRVIEQENENKKEVEMGKTIKCEVCGRAVDMYEDDWAACDKCGKPVCKRCDSRTGDDEFFCEECREKTR